jgi:hypothetical protein
MSTERTPIANYDAPAIQMLFSERGWRDLPEHERIGAVYRFVKDELPFGYNRDDALPASEVLADGYGQCNTKGNLLVALLRGLGVPARFHGFTIDKALQRGAIPPWLYRITPARILHSWVEVQHCGEWIPLEGFILDRAYLEAIQARCPDVTGAFCGYGIATRSLHSPDVEWRGAPTYIQSEGIVDDFGVFEDPDEFYAAHGTNLGGLRRWLYASLLRHVLNRNVARIRTGHVEAPRGSGRALQI